MPALDASPEVLVNSAHAKMNQENQHHTRAVYLVGLFAGILAVSTASIFIRFAQQEVPSLVIAAGRMVISTLVMLPFALSELKRNPVIFTRKKVLLLVFAGVSLGLHFATWITSLEYTSVASSVVLVTTAPLWVALFSPLILKERITKQVLIGLIVSLVGGIIVGISSNCAATGGKITCSGLGDLLGGANSLGNLLAFAGALLSGAYLIAGRKVRSTIALPVYTFIVYGIAALILMVLMLLKRDSVTGYSPMSYVWILALALIPQSIGHTAFNWALKFLPAAYVSIALLGEPVGTIMLAALLLHEAPTSLELLGGLLVLTGIVVATQRIATKKRPPE